MLYTHLTPHFKMQGTFIMFKCGMGNVTKEYFILINAEKYVFKFVITVKKSLKLNNKNIKLLKY